MDDSNERNARDENTTVGQSEATVAQIESERETTTPIDNDHTINDVTTHNKLQETSAALAKEKTKRRTNPLLTLLLSLLLISLGAATGIMVYKYFFEKPTPTDTVSTTSVPAQTQDQKLLAVIQRIRELVPNMLDPQPAIASAPMHRLMGAPYNFYAAAPYDKRFDVTTADTVELASAAKAAKAIHSYFVNDQKAKADKVIDESNDGSFLIKEGALGAGGAPFYRYRYTTDTYTCGMFEQSGSSADTTAISVICQTANNYLASAKIQQPFYEAFRSSPQTSQQERQELMLDTPESARPSQVIGYKTITATLAGDHLLAGSSQALFYQTPDKKWRFFTSTQDSLRCNKYTTVDLKKAYLGTTCFTEDDKESVVSL